MSSFLLLLLTRLNSWKLIKVFNVNKSKLISFHNILFLDCYLLAMVLKKLKYFNAIYIDIDKYVYRNKAKHHRFLNVLLNLRISYFELRHFIHPFLGYPSRKVQNQVNFPNT